MDLASIFFGKFYSALMLSLVIRKDRRGVDMTKDLTKLGQHIDEMRARLNQTAHTERSRVESLGDALNRLDQEMLQNIRNIAAGHEFAARGDPQ